MLEHRQLHPLLDSRLARWLMVASWMALIFFLSSQPQLPSPPDPLADLIFKKGAHFTVYAVLAVLYAASDEWHQSFVPGRHPPPSDVLIDTAGATAGLLLLWWWQRRQRRLQRLEGWKVGKLEGEKGPVRKLEG
jgi:VanZ family protein